MNSALHTVVSQPSGLLPNHVDLAVPVRLMQGQNEAQLEGDAFIVNRERVVFSATGASHRSRRRWKLIWLSVKTTASSSTINSISSSSYESHASYVKRVTCESDMLPQPQTVSSPAELSSPNLRMWRERREPAKQKMQRV